MGRAREVLGRQWRIVRELQTARRGLTVSQLVERIGVSRATLYRDVALLRDEGGFPIVDEPINGEVRYRLDSDALPPLAPTVDQAAALRVGRSLLAPLDGTELAGAYDEVLATVGTVAESAHVSVARVDPRGSGVRRIEAAIKHGRRVRLRYRASSRGGAVKKYLVEPVFLHVTGGDLYLVAFSVDAGARRTFKLARVEAVEWTDEKAGAHPEITATGVFAASRKAWAGDLVDVRVKLSAAVAWKATEYPVHPEQTVTTQEDGSVVVEARVAGTVEVLSWVLGWGADAEALAPAELRLAVAGELRLAARRYEPSVAKPRLKSMRRRGAA